MKGNLFRTFIKSSFIACFIVNSALAIVPFDELSSLLADKTLQLFEYKTFTFKPIINDKNKQHQLWEWKDYFSTHTPYSQAQFEQYFGTKFYPKKDELNPDAIELPLYTDDSQLNIANIDFRDRTGGQLFIINLRSAVCFSREEFKNNMQKQGYGLELSPPKVYFSKKMSNPQGQMSLGLAEIKDKSLRCVDSLIFDTFPD